MPKRINKRKHLSAFGKTDRRFVRTLQPLENGNATHSEDDFYKLLKGPHGLCLAHWLNKQAKKVFAHRVYRKERLFRDMLRRQAQSIRLGRRSIAWKGLRQFAPEALELLAHYGSFYTPHPELLPLREIFNDVPNGRCHETAVVCILTFRGLKNKPIAPVVYAEGIDMGVVWPYMLHCWNAWTLKSKVAIDAGCYATTQWTRYFGISLTFEELLEIWNVPKGRDAGTAILFDKRNFGKIRKNLEAVLAARQAAT